MPQYTCISKSQMFKSLLRWEKNKTKTTKSNLYSQVLLTVWHLRRENTGGYGKRSLTLEKVPTTDKSDDH